MKGTRLTGDWVIPREWAMWAKEERPDLNVVETVEEFKDFWVEAADLGKKMAWKVSWLKTWRNWVRRQSAPNGKPMSHQPRKEKLPDRKEWQRSKDIARKHMSSVKRAIK